MNEELNEVLPQEAPLLQQHQSKWTPDEDLILAARIEEGIPFSRIALELDRTRQACIGHANRLGIVHPNKMKARNFGMLPELQWGRGPQGRFPPEPPPKTPIYEIAPNAQFKPLEELNPRTECHYPHGNSPFLFCAAPRERGSYCKFHHKLTHTPLRR